VTTTIFSAVDAILVRPLPYAEPDRLVAVYAQNAARGYSKTKHLVPGLPSWRDESRTLERWHLDVVVVLAVREGGDAERVEARASPRCARSRCSREAVAGPRARAEEETPGARRRRAARATRSGPRRYGADSSIVGRTITSTATPRVRGRRDAAGVPLPERGELWMPLPPDAAADSAASRYHAGAIGRG
jgi:hypothetical protein